MLRLACVLFLGLSAVSALYSPSDDVVELTASNFNSKVVNGDEVWMVEFYAPWCGHCKTLAPEWKKAAKALKGIVKVGAVDMDVHQSVGGPYNVRGFPTIKVFGLNKNSPDEFQSGRDANSIVQAALKAAQQVASARLSGKSGSGGGGSGSGSSGSADDVVTLTDSNFEKEVLGTKDPVLVEFYAPWCGHCQRLKPEWEKAASELKGKVKVAALDAQQYPVMAGRFQVQGYPTIKFFPAGAKDFNSAEDYAGGRTASDIIAFGNEKASDNVEAPEIVELTSNDILKQECNDKPLCVVAVLPDILDTQAAGRNAHIAMLKEIGEKYKKKMWGYVWTAGAIHSNLEGSLGIGGFGYPAMAVVNLRKKVYVMLKGSFSKEGVDELLKGIAVGRGRTEKLPAGLPTIETVPAWDGQDGQLPEEEDIDLSDVDLDDEEEGAKKEEL